MNTTIQTRARCSRQLHKLTDFNYSIEGGKPICKSCRDLFGKAYDGEWTNRDLEALFRDYETALLCRCGGPTCGPNARTKYRKLYPTLAQLFA